MMDRRESANLDRFLTTPPEPVYECAECGCEIPEDLDATLCTTCASSIRELVQVAERAVAAARAANLILDDLDARLQRGDSKQHVLNALRQQRRAAESAS